MMTFKSGDVFAENYKLVRLIDTGAFAEVWEAVFLPAGNTVALKIFPRLDEQGVKNIETEYKSQSELLHTHLLVARYFGKHLGHPYLEMKYCSGGNASKKIGELTEKEATKCLNQIASALAYLHRNDIIHQDIKPNNFLLDQNQDFYLADLGLSLKVRNTIRKFTQSTTGANVSSIATGLTPPPYRAPELYERKGDQTSIKSSDIWALGASVFELITEDVPFGEFGGMMQLADPSVPDLPDGFSPEFNEILKRCLAKDAWDRPMATDLVQWSQEYLNTGAWPSVEESIPHTRSNDYGRTVTDSAKLTGDYPNIPKKTKIPWFPVSIAIVAVVGLIVMSLWAMTDHSDYPKNLLESSPSNTQEIDKDTIKPLLEVHKEGVEGSGIIDKKETEDGEHQPESGSNEKLTQPILLKDVKPKMESEQILLSSPKQYSCREVNSIRRGGDGLIVRFRLKKSCYTKPYDPSDPYAYYIEDKVTGNQYDLLKLTSVSLEHPDYEDIEAIFQKVPNSVKSIDIIEGEFRKGRLDFVNIRLK